MPSAREASRPKEAESTEKDKNPFTGEASIEFRFFFNARVCGKTTTLN